MVIDLCDGDSVELIQNLINSDSSVVHSNFGNSHIIVSNTLSYYNPLLLNDSDIGCWCRVDDNQENQFPDTIASPLNKIGYQCTRRLKFYSRGNSELLVSVNKLNVLDNPCREKVLISTYINFSELIFKYLAKDIGLFGFKFSENLFLLLEYKHGLERLCNIYWFNSLVEFDQKCLDCCNY